MRARHLSIVVAASLIVAAAQTRADGYEPASAAAPGPLRTSNWTGFYANAGIGYGFWSAQTTTDDAGGCVSCTTTDHSGRDWLGEAGLGYDYRFGNSIVAGVLFSYAFSDMNGNVGDSVFTTAKTASDSTWFLGVRAGWLMKPDILAYWSGGYTQTHFSGGALRNSFTGAPLPGRLDSTDADGWFLGGGLELAMHGGWYWRNEVRYADYGKEVRAETMRGAPLFNLNFDPVVATATTGIVYKFDWGR